MTVNDDGLVHLQALKKLRELDLSATSVMSAGMVHLTALPNLETLHLSVVGVGDEGLKTLATIPSLKVLDLVHNHNVTLDGIRELRAARPDLEVLR